MTMNSPESLTELYNLATDRSKDKKQSIETAELMREIGLKCIGFNGVRFTLLSDISDTDHVTGPKNHQLSRSLQIQST